VLEINTTKLILIKGEDIVKEEHIKEIEDTIIRDTEMKEDTMEDIREEEGESNINQRLHNNSIGQKEK